MRLRLVMMMIVVVVVVLYMHALPGLGGMMDTT